MNITAAPQPSPPSPSQAPKTEPLKAATATSAPEHAGHNKETGPVRVFAVMRQTHEAIRDGLKDIEEATDALQTAGAAGDVYTLQAAFEGLMRMVKLHMRQEEECFF